MSIETMKLALEALQFGLHVGFDESSERQIQKGGKAFDQHNQAITALRQAIEQAQKQEPVAMVISETGDESVTMSWWHEPALPVGTQLYITPPQRQPLTADEMKEPKNGEQWHVVWWNESCRMVLPSDAKLDSFTSYKNGTLQFTIKKAAHGIKGEA